MMDVVSYSQLKQFNRNQTATKIIKMKLHARVLLTITAIAGTSSFASASSNAPLSDCESRADTIKNLCIGASDEGDNLENFVNFLRILDRSDFVDLPDECTLIASRLLNPRVVNQRFSLIRDNHNTICHLISTCMVDNNCVDGDDVYDTYDSDKGSSDEDAFVIKEEEEDEEEEEEDSRSKLTPTLYDPVSQHPDHVYHEGRLDLSAESEDEDEDNFYMYERSEESSSDDMYDDDDDDEDENWRGFHPMYDDEDEDDEEDVDIIPSLPHQPYNGPVVKGPKEDEMRPPNRRLLRGSKPQ